MHLTTISTKMATAIYRWPCPNNARRSLKKLLAAVVCLLVFVGALYISGIRINTSSSLPLGVWRVQKIDASELRIGDSVAINRAAVPNARTHLMKDVGALPGDVMTREGNIVCRNGQPLPQSTIQDAKWHGEKIDCIEYPVVVPEGHIWLSSRHERGYDSRYFGAVPAQAVIGKAVLLWAW